MVPATPSRQMRSTASERTIRLRGLAGRVASHCRHRSAAEIYPRLLCQPNTCRQRSKTWPTLIIFDAMRARSAVQCHGEMALRFSPSGNLPNCGLEPYEGVNPSADLRLAA